MQIDSWLVEFVLGLLRAWQFEASSYKATPRGPPSSLGYRASRELAKAFRLDPSKNWRKNMATRSRDSALPRKQRIIIVRGNPRSVLRYRLDEPRQLAFMFAGDVYELFGGTDDAAFVVTLEGEICFWNAAAERLFGYAAKDVLNKTCSEVLKGNGAFGTAVFTGCSVQRCAERNRSIPTFDLEVTTHSGKRKWVSVSTIVFDESRCHRRLIVHLAHDISERKELERAFSKMLDVSKQVISLGDRGSRPAPVELISEQEQRILSLFAKAKNSGEVARELGITLPTLRNHLHAINKKLRTHTRLEAVLHAMKRGLI